MKNVMRKSEFAKHMGVNRSTVTRWAQNGRLVLAENDCVKVEESIHRIGATEGNRADLKSKHAKGRGAELPQTEKSTSENDGSMAQAISEEMADLSASEQSLGLERAEYKAQKLDFENRLIYLKLDLDNGTRCAKEDHLKRLHRLGAEIKAMTERLVDNLAPQLGVLNHNDRRARVSAEIEKNKAAL